MEYLQQIHKMHNRDREPADTGPLPAMWGGANATAGSNGQNKPAIGGSMRILVACEESQAVTIELRRRGHEAYSCDVEPCSVAIRNGIYSKMLFPYCLNHGT